MLKSTSKPLKLKPIFIFFTALILCTSIVLAGIIIYDENVIIYRILSVIGIILILLSISSFVSLFLRYSKMQFFKESVKIEKELQSILKNMINAFVVWESVFDEEGEYVSFKFGYFNDAYSKISKLRLEDVRGRDVFDVWPSTEKKWLDIYREVAMTGKSITFELYHEPTNGLYHCNAYRPTDSKDRICVIFADITETRRAEEALRESERHFRLLVEGAPDAIFIRIGTRIVYVNNMAVSLFGADTAAQLIGETIIDRVHPSFHKRVHEQIRLDEKKIWHQPISEQIYLRMDGSEVPVEVSTVPIDYEGRNGAVVFVRDVSERIKAHEELRKSEERYKSLFTYNNAVMLVIDPETNNIVDANPAACEYYGRTLEEITSIRMQDISMIPDDRIIESARQIRNGKLKYLPSRHKLKDGTIRDVENYTAPIVVGEKTLIYCIIHDITERKLAENLLEEEKELLSVTLRSIGDGVITTDLNGNVVIMNKVAGNLTGWSDSEAEGKPLREVFNIISEITREPHKNPVEIVLETGIITELANHTILISRDGTERIIADSGAPIKDKNSITIGVVLVFRDITEKQKLMESLQRTEKLNSIGIMAGGIAHDFNNLLNAIYGYIELAQNELQNNAVYSEYLNKALKSYNRAKGLTHQLLTFAKGGNPVLKTGDLGLILVNNAEFALAGTNVSFELNIPEDLWPADFDENQISQVFNNIILNARQSMPEGGEITINAKNIYADEIVNKKYLYKNYIRISIIDSGQGIPREIINKIFDPFFTTKSGGSGLGLATSFSIIKNHDGYIEVDSEPGYGSAFHIFLPASEHITYKEADKAVEKHKGSGEIIIMDDEEFILDVVGTIIEKMGYVPVKASNGEQALKLFNEGKAKGSHIKALLLDLTIGRGMGGKETITEIRKIDKDIPAFASSGYSEDPVMSNPGDYGFTDSISKPYKIADLAEMLNKYLGRVN